MVTVPETREFRCRSERHVPYYPQKLTRVTSDPETGVLRYGERTSLKVNTILISVVGAAPPVIAVVILYFTGTAGARIGAMAGFTVIFALALASFPNSRRPEIAASTAA